MDLKTGMIIFGEIIFTGALIYLFYKEDKVLELEKRIIKKIKNASAKNRRARKIKRQNKINRKALYIPVRANKMGTKTKAA